MKLIREEIESVKVITEATKSGKKEPLHRRCFSTRKHKEP